MTLHKTCRFVMTLLLTGALTPMFISAAPAKKDDADKKPAAEKKAALAKKAATEKKESPMDQQTTEAKYYQMTLERQQKIEALVKEYVAKQKDISNPKVVESIESDIKIFMPVLPAKDTQNKSMQELNKEAEIQVNKKYSKEFETDLLAKAKDKAEKKFPMVEKNAKVTITYRQGPFEYTVDGIYYGADARTIQVGGKRIPLVDLPAEVRPLYDVKLNQEQRNKYISEVKANLEKKRQTTKQQIFEELLLAQGQENAKRGYIYDKRHEEWITARELMNRYIKIELRKIQAAQAKQAKEIAAAEAAGGDAPAGMIKGSDGKLVNFDPKQYEEILEKAKKQQVEINKKYSGLDANQGFRLAFWNATRHEVSYLFSQEKDVTFSQTISCDIITVKTPAPIQPNKVECYYKPNLYKTVEYFPDQSYDDFAKMQKQFHEKFGQTLEEKEFQRDLFAEIDEGKLTSEALRGDKPAEKGMENMYVFHWKGDYTQGTFTFRYDEASDSYVGITFTKEFFPAGVKK